GGRARRVFYESERGSNQAVHQHDPRTWAKVKTRSRFYAEASRCWPPDRKTKAQSKGDIDAQGKSERRRRTEDELLAPQLSQGSDGGRREWRCRATTSHVRSRLWEVHPPSNEGGGDPEGRCDHG